MVHALVAFLIAVPGAVLFVGLGQGLLKMMGKDPTLTDRTQIWDLLLSSDDKYVEPGLERASKTSGWDPD